MGKLLIILLASFSIFVSCKEVAKEKNIEYTTVKESAKEVDVSETPDPGLIEYDLIKVEHGELIDVIFRITNGTSKAKQFEEITQSINANLIVEKKFINAESKPAKVKINSERFVLNTGISEKNGWEQPLKVYGIAIPPEPFILKPGERKDYMILSSYSRAELQKELGRKLSSKLLMRARFSNPGDIEITTNTIELK